MKLHSLQEEFKQNNRLRYGLWLIFCIVLSYLCLLLYDEQQQLKSEYFAYQGRIYDVDNVSRQSEWVERAELTSALKAEFGSKLWRSRSEGLAQATFQTWLDQQLTGFKLTNARLQMLAVEPVGDVLKLWKVSARLQADFDPSVFQRFMFRLENYSQITVVDSLTIRNGRRKNVDLTITAWFQLGQ